MPSIVSKQQTRGHTMLFWLEPSSDWTRMQCKSHRQKRSYVWVEDGRMYRSGSKTILALSLRVRSGIMHFEKDECLATWRGPDLVKDRLLQKEVLRWIPTDLPSSTGWCAHHRGRLRLVQTESIQHGPKQFCLFIPLQIQVLRWVV